MKTACILFMIVGFGTLTMGMSYAGEPSKQPAEQDPNEKQTTLIHPAERVHGNVDQPELKRPQAKNNSLLPEKSSKAGSMNAQTKHTPASEFYQPGFKMTDISPNTGLMVNKAGNHLEQFARLPVGSATTAPRPNLVRSRSATTAIIGELTFPGAKHSAAAIDGSAIKRKP